MTPTLCQIFCEPVICTNWATMTTTAFPILDLPEKARLNAFKTMENVNLISLSFCSQRSKSIVKSTELLHASEFIIILSTHITISMNFDNSFQVYFYLNIDALESTCQNSIVPLKLGIPNRVETSFDKIADDYGTAYSKYDFEWANPGLEIGYYVEHLLDVSNCDRIDKVICDTEAYPIDFSDLTKVFGGLKVRKFKFNKWYGREYPDEEARRHKANSDKLIFRAIMPVVNALEINENRMENDLPLVFIQNLDKFKSFYISHQYQLNDILMMNCEHIHLSSDAQALSIKDLNLFLKCWMKGSNMNLEYLVIYGRNAHGSNVVDVVNGIKHLEISKTLDLCFQLPRKLHSFISLKGSSSLHHKRYNIRRLEDGAVATVKIDVMNRRDTSFFFKVWNEVDFENNPILV
ncbi:F-box domain-containing protein [Caenorhabditis elegans]|uniref:F-box domain-containing protein n=1 Tax=Caenorhabditis elegans TaxID=6239 RepID=O18134_CAEEL|nr:F-box domain-containing protein [Caenorhabditis elegans]CAB04843.1 F-box domain-containing protein [Caenorhabditis elegans]|eukprot:NP_507742.1 F-box B protein [Caenorhabditis elegans]